MFSRKLPKNNPRKSFFDLHPEIYEAMIPWEKRLSRELPFIQALLEKNKARTLLDIGCGPGHHVLALQKAGYEASGLDYSMPMVKYAQSKANEAGVPARFIQGDILNLKGKIKTYYDAVLALGNMLAGLPSIEALESSLTQIHACLKPGGLFLMQALNYQKLLAKGNYDIPPRPFIWNGQSCLFLRHFEKEADKVQTAFILLLEKDNQWQSEYFLSQHLLLGKTLLKTALQKAGFQGVSFKSSFDLKPHQPAAGQDIICIAQA